MKRKFVISLILVICCLIASIPASADAAPYALSCPGGCGPFNPVRCTWATGDFNCVHSFYIDNLYKECSYIETRSYLVKMCQICSKYTGVGWHVHEESEHTPNYCGRNNGKITCTYPATA